MEIIKCEYNRLIMLLSSEDLQKYGINSESALIENVRTLLCDCGMSDDFSSCRRLLVKIFESKEGGCELFITRLGDGIIAPEAPAVFKNKYIYRFSGLENLLLACRALRASGFDGDSDIRYDGDRKHYYLIIDREYENINEFGGVSCRRSSLLYIEEHCIRLCNCTVDLLSTMI